MHLLHYFLYVAPNLRCSYSGPTVLSSRSRPEFDFLVAALAARPVHRPLSFRVLPAPQRLERTRLDGTPSHRRGLARDPARAGRVLQPVVMPNSTPAPFPCGGTMANTPHGSFARSRAYTSTRYLSLASRGRDGGRLACLLWSNGPWGAMGPPGMRKLTPSTSAASARSGRFVVALPSRSSSRPSDGRGAPARAGACTAWLLRLEGRAWQPTLKDRQAGGPRRCATSFRAIRTTTRPPASCRSRESD